MENETELIEAADPNELLAKLGTVTDKTNGNEPCWVRSTAYRDGWSGMVPRWVFIRPSKNGGIEAAMGDNAFTNMFDKEWLPFFKNSADAKDFIKKFEDTHHKNLAYEIRPEAVPAGYVFENSSIGNFYRPDNKTWNITAIAQSDPKLKLALKKCDLINTRRTKGTFIELQGYQVIRELSQEKPKLWQTGILWAFTGNLSSVSLKQSAEDVAFIIYIYLLDRLVLKTKSFKIASELENMFDRLNLKPLSKMIFNTVTNELFHDNYWSSTKAEVLKSLKEIGEWLINELSPKEFDNLYESLDEKVEKHDTLNPKLWNSDGTLKDEVSEKIMQIVDEFVDGLAEDGIKLKVADVELIGSNCSYNYNDKSDLDVHIIADISDTSCPDNLYPLLYGAYRSIWNKNHDIDFYGIPVELYVETIGGPTEEVSDDTEASESIDLDTFADDLTVLLDSDITNIILDGDWSEGEAAALAEFGEADRDDYDSIREIVEMNKDNITAKMAEMVSQLANTDPLEADWDANDVGEI